jgi:hypothetical protein
MDCHITWAWNSFAPYDANLSSSDEDIWVDLRSDDSLENGFRVKHISDFWLNVRAEFVNKTSQD